MLNILKQGGVTIIPLLLCSIVSLAVGLERFIYLKRAKGNNFRLIKKVKLMLNNSKFGEAKEIIEEERGPVAGILMEGLRFYGQRQYEIKDKLEIVGHNEVKKLERRLGVLDFIATVAPLLGLLGTVLGIIDSFNILAAVQGMASPDVLSVGIAQALISTAVGLIVAIPALLIYTYLMGLVEKRTEEMNYWFIEVVEVLSKGGKNV